MFETNIELITSPLFAANNSFTINSVFFPAKEIFELLNNQKNPNRLIIFATHNRFFANKADCLLEMTNGSVKTINV